jgi:5-methylcytosine-specific restriction endonuclease McrA
VKWQRGVYFGYSSAHSVARELGFGGIKGGGLWQADHVIECVNGGWGMGLDNFRTLCTLCHKEETARLAAELSERRKIAKFPESLFRISVTHAD